MEEQRREAGWLLWQSLSYLGRMLRPQMEPLLRDVGLNSPLEAWVLHLLRHRGPQRLVDIARGMRLPVSTLSDLTERLVAEGLLRRMPHPRDRRSVVLVATERAADGVARLHAAVAERLAGPLAELDDGTLEQLTVGLRALAEALERAAGPCYEPGGVPQPGSVRAGDVEAWRDAGPRPASNVEG